MVAYTFSPGTQEAEVGGSLNFKPNLQSEFQGNQGYKETLSWKKKKERKRRYYISYHKNFSRLFSFFKNSEQTLTMSPSFHFKSNSIEGITFECCSFNFIIIPGSSLLLAMSNLNICSRYLLIISSKADWCSSKDVRSSIENNVLYSDELRLCQTLIGRNLKMKHATKKPLIFYWNKSFMLCMCVCACLSPCRAHAQRS